MVTQTILVEQYWREIHDGLTAAGIPVHHFLLDTGQKTLAERIETDTKPEGIDARQCVLTTWPTMSEPCPGSVRRPR